MKGRTGWLGDDSVLAIHLGVVRASSIQFVQASGCLTVWMWNLAGIAADGGNNPGREEVDRNIRQVSGWALTGDERACTVTGILSSPGLLLVRTVEGEIQKVSESGRVQV